MIHRCLESFTGGFSAVPTGKLDSQYFVGSDASFGHSIKSQPIRQIGR